MSPMINRSNVSLGQKELGFISDLKIKLERILLTDIKVIICPSKGFNIKIAIEIDSNFSLPEAISLVKMGSMKSKQSTDLGMEILRFQNCIYSANHSSDISIDIEEVSLYFKNTSIIINSIECNSLVEEIESIIAAILFHFKFYSTLMGAIPNAIHIPVLEDMKAKKLLNLTDVVKLTSYTSPYSQFWGLYYDFLDKPLIYDLYRTNIIPGDLDLSLE